MSDQLRNLEIAILVCPGFLPVDIIGVHTGLGYHPGVNVHLVWKNLDEISGSPAFPTRATTTFDDCPADLDVLCVGAVPAEILEDAETLAFLADRGGRAGWVAGICAGSLLLGAAGLLRGYRATTNFHSYDLLSHYGATAIHTPSVVEDRNRLTAGPATGSIEIALRLLQIFFGTEVAQLSELNMEYAPQPLFGVGTPEQAGPDLTAVAIAATADAIASYREVSERASARLNVTAHQV